VQIDVRLDEIVLRALEKNPELRYQQASVFKTQVETVAESPESRKEDFTFDQSKNPEIKPRSAWRTALIAAGVGLAVWLITSLVATVVTLNRPDSYQADAKLLLQRLVPAGMTIPPAWFPEEAKRYLEMQPSIIRSAIILNTVVTNLNLNTEWGRRYANGEKLSTDATAKLLQSRLEIPPLRNSANVITLHFIGETATEATDILRAIIQSYLEFNTQRKTAYNKAPKPKDPSELVRAPFQPLYDIAMVQAPSSALSLRPAKIAQGIILGFFPGLAASLVTWLRLRLRAKARARQRAAKTPSPGSSQREEPPKDDFSFDQSNKQEPKRRSPLSVGLIVAAVVGLGTILYAAITVNKEKRFYEEARILLRADQKKTNWSESDLIQAFNQFLKIAKSPSSAGRAAEHPATVVA